MPTIDVGRQTTPAEGILGILSGLGQGLGQIQQARQQKDLEALQLLAKNPNVQLAPLAPGEATPTSFGTRLLTGRQFEPGPTGSPVVNVGGAPVAIRPQPPLDLSSLFGGTGGSGIDTVTPGTGAPTTAAPGAVSPIRESGGFSSAQPSAQPPGQPPQVGAAAQGGTPQTDTLESSVQSLQRLAKGLPLPAPAALQGSTGSAVPNIPALRATPQELIAEPGIRFAAEAANRNPGDIAARERLATLVNKAGNDIVTRKQKQYELEYGRSKDLGALKADALKALQDAGQFQGSASLRQQIIDAPDAASLLPALGQASEAVATNKESQQTFERVKSTAEIQARQGGLELERQRTLGNEPSAATKAVLAAHFQLPYWTLATPQQLQEARKLADTLDTDKAAQHEAAVQAEKPLDPTQAKGIAGTSQSLRELNDIYTLYQQIKASGKDYVGNFTGPLQQIYKFTGNADADSVVLQNMLSALALDITRAQTGLVSTDDERAQIAKQLPLLKAGDASFLPSLQALGRRLSQTIDTDIAVAKTPKKALESLKPSTAFDTALPSSTPVQTPAATPGRPTGVRQGAPGQSPQGPQAQTALPSTQEITAAATLFPPDMPQARAEQIFTQTYNAPGMTATQRGALVLAFSRAYKGQSPPGQGAATPSPTAITPTRPVPAAPAQTPTSQADRPAPAPSVDPQHLADIRASLQKYTPQQLITMGAATAEEITAAQQGGTP